MLLEESVACKEEVGRVKEGRDSRGREGEREGKYKSGEKASLSELEIRKRGTYPVMKRAPNSGMSPPSALGVSTKLLIRPASTSI